MRELSERYCANISMLFTETTMLERPIAARAAGFQNVESWWPFATHQPDHADVNAFVDALHRASVHLRALNFYAGDMGAGERGVACLPDRQEELDASFTVLLEIAERTGCRLFNLLYGRLDDRWSEEEQQDVAVAAIRRAAERVAPIGGVVLLEPLAQGLNGSYPLTTGYDVGRLLTGRLSELDNVGLLFDMFHLGSNGVDLITAACDLVQQVRHVQIADAPGRGEPGSGKTSN